jgi:ANTAR domain
VSELAARKPPGPNVQPPTLTEMPNRSDAGSADSSEWAELARIRKENAELKEALRTRTVIGQATGLLMARLSQSPDEAFAELVKRSSYANRKVRDIAAEIVAAATASTPRENQRLTNLPESLLRSSDLGADEAGSRVRRGQAQVRSCEDTEE